MNPRASFRLSSFSVAFAALLLAGCATPGQLSASAGDAPPAHLSGTPPVVAAAAAAAAAPAASAPTTAAPGATAPAAAGTPPAFATVIKDAKKIDGLFTLW